MQKQTTQPTLLDGIYGLGERLCAALAEDDLDAFCTLVQERRLLVERLGDFRHPADVDPGWEARAAALAQQHEAIVAAAQAQEQRLRTALEMLEHAKRASEHYTDRPPASGILNKHLCG